MDLISIFGLNSRFGAVWERITIFPRGFAHSRLTRRFTKEYWQPRRLGSCRQRDSGFAGQRSIVALGGWRVGDGAHRLIVMKNPKVDLSVESHFSKREKWGTPSWLVPDGLRRAALESLR
jgi:hypothetical protein